MTVLTTNRNNWMRVLCAMSDEDFAELAKKFCGSVPTPDDEDVQEYFRDNHTTSLKGYVIDVCIDEDDYNSLQALANLHKVELDNRDHRALTIAKLLAITTDLCSIVEDDDDADFAGLSLMELDSVNQSLVDTARDLMGKDITDDDFDRIEQQMDKYRPEALRCELEV